MFADSVSQGQERRGVGFFTFIDGRSEFNSQRTCFDGSIEFRS